MDFFKKQKDFCLLRAASWYYSASENDALHQIITAKVSFLVDDQEFQASTVVSRLTIGRAGFQSDTQKRLNSEGTVKTISPLTAPWEGASRDSPYSWIRGSESLPPSSLTPSTKSRSVCTKGHRCSRQTRNETERAERRSGNFKAPRADTNQFLGNSVSKNRGAQNGSREKRQADVMCVQSRGGGVGVGEEQKAHNENAPEHK